MVGRLIYLKYHCQFMHDPREVHMEALFKVLKYLKSSLGQGIHFKRGGSLILEAYTDAD